MYVLYFISGEFVADEVYILSIKYSCCFVKHVCVHVCMYVHVCICVHVCMYMYVYVYVLCICICVYVFICMIEVGCICVYVWDTYMCVCEVWGVLMYWFCLQHHINLHNGPCLSS